MRMDDRQFANLNDQRVGVKGAAEIALAIVQSSEDAIISKALDGTITSWNARAAEMFGYAADEIIGQSVLVLFPPDRLQEEQKILERINRGERVSHFDTVRLRKGGTPIDVSVTISPIHDAEGRIDGASKFVRDISERKKRERHLESIALETSRILVERTNKLGESEAALLAQTQLMNTMLREFGMAERLKVEGERKRLSQELHDEIGQMLTALSLNLEMVRRKANDPAVQLPLTNAQDIAEEIVTSVRRIIHGLRPPQLDEHGLLAAVRWHMDAIRPLTGMKLTLEENLGTKRLPKLVELNCFRIVQEALTNVQRHAGARHTLVRIEYTGNGLQLIIDDDGVGMTDHAYRQSAQGHLGLRGIEERANALKGRLHIASTPITGCRLTIDIPLNDDAEGVA